MRTPHDVARADRRALRRHDRGHLGRVDGRPAVQRVDAAIRRHVEQHAAREDRRHGARVGAPGAEVAGVLGRRVAAVPVRVVPGADVAEGVDVRARVMARRVELGVDREAAAAATGHVALDGAALRGAVAHERERRVDPAGIGMSCQRPASRS